MIEYKKARKLDDLVVVEARDQIMIGHKEYQEQGWLCLRTSEFDAMTGVQIKNKFNEYIDGILDSIANQRPIEIEPGQPQIKWNKECQQWTPEGDVLRCEVSWHPTGPDGAIAIKIDGKLLSGPEFLDVLEVQEGAGMRIEFMHPNRLTNRPEPVMQKTRKGK